MVHDLVIKNGTVVDGTGGAAFAADVAVDGEKISAIGTNLDSGKKEIDAKGHVVAPGFIDSHTHMDAFVVQYPNGNPVVNYGVTSIVIGDCGASCAPVPPKPEPRQVLVRYLRRVLDKYVDDKDWRWNTFGEYLSYLEGKVAINCLPLMPHSPVRLTDMGEAAYQRGLQYLLKIQLEDGSWHVSSRSKPFQPYYESGFPHGKDQFISCAATGWATWALTLAIER